MYLLWVIWEGAVHIGSGHHAATDAEGNANSKIQKTTLGQCDRRDILSHGLPIPTATKVILMILI